MCKAVSVNPYTQATEEIGLSQANLFLRLLCQVMSIEDVERIMDETQEAIEYQRVILLPLTPLVLSPAPRCMAAIFF